MEISFKDILRIIKKNLIFILIVSLIFALSSFFVTKFFVQKSYTSTVKLYISTDYSGSNSGYQDLYAYNYSSKLVSTCIELLDTNNFYGSVSKSLNSKYTATQIKTMVKFTRVEETEVFKAEITSSSPAEAKNIADAVTKTAPETVKEHLSNNSTLKVIDEATTPKNPTSPNVAKNVIIAFLIGIVISLIIAFVRDYFDVKIKYDDEMTTIANLPVLGAIPDFEYFAKNTKSNSSKYAKITRGE